MAKTEPTTRSSTEVDPTRSDIDAFLAEMTKAQTSGISGTGRLIFALDATMSRGKTWDMACQLQGDMFRTVASIGGLNVQLVYYRALDECRASKWVSDPNHLAKLMTKIDCRAGHTQIGKVLAQAKRETAVLKVSALVFVGDAFEEEEDEILPRAHELARAGVPVFMLVLSSGSSARSLDLPVVPTAASIADRQLSWVNCSKRSPSSPLAVGPHWQPVRTPARLSCSVS